MFLPQDFCLLPKAVDPDKPHRRHFQTPYSSITNSTKCTATSRMWRALTWPSLWIHCRFLWWLDLSRPWSYCELLPVSCKSRRVKTRARRITLFNLKKTCCSAGTLYAQLSLWVCTAVMNSSSDHKEVNLHKQKCVKTNTKPHGTETWTQTTPFIRVCVEK